MRGSRSVLAAGFRILVSFVTVMLFVLFLSPFVIGHSEAHHGYWTYGKNTKTHPSSGDLSGRLSYMTPSIGIIVSSLRHPALDGLSYHSDQPTRMHRSQAFSSCTFEEAITKTTVNTWRIGHRNTAVSTTFPNSPTSSFLRQEVGLTETLRMKRKPFIGNTVSLQ